MPDDEKPPVGCQYYQLPHLAQAYPWASCIATATRRLDDVIPSLMLCADHFAEYESRRQGAVIGEGVPMIIDRRYVRVLDPVARHFGDWHEMPDETSRALCGGSIDFFFEERDEPYQYQHQRGTSFPRGMVCKGCYQERAWLDREQDGPIFDSPDAQW